MSAPPKIALLFPGQGAQYPGMGRDFAESYAAARETFEEANDRLGLNLSHIVFEGPQELLTETRYSQLAIYTASLAILRVLQQIVSLTDPYVCAGLSLGEYSALTASRRVSFQDCLPVVRCRADAMHAACLERQGTMAVVMGMDADQLIRVVEALQMPHDLWVANLNCPGQVVISGTVRGIEKGSAAALRAGAKRVVPLQVSGAFHSGLMRSAEESLTPAIQSLSLKKSSSALVMNVPGDFVDEEALVRQFLIQQVTHPVRWESGVRAMMKHGIDLFLEIGPGKTLTGMAKRIGVTAPCLNVESLDDLKEVEKLLNQRSNGSWNAC